MYSSGRDVMRWMLAIAIVSAVIAAAPARARAEDARAKARVQVTAADIDYRLGRFTEALEEYTRAYQLYPVPPLLFNIGQCHKNLGDHAKAIFFFEGYLRDDPKTADRAVVEDLIRESRAALERASASRAEPPPAPEPVPPAVVSPPPAPSDIGASPRTAGPQRPETRTPGPSRIVPAVLVVGGVAALAGGGVFYYFGQKRGAGEKYLYDDTRLLGGTLMVVGAAAAVTGVVLWRRASHGAGAPVAALTPDSGYLGWVGTF